MGVCAQPFGQLGSHFTHGSRPFLPSLSNAGKGTSKEFDTWDISPYFSLLFLLFPRPFLLQHGVIVADEEEYFIEPLSPGANVSAGNEGEGSPHVVYKRSSLQYPHMDAACGVLGICASDSNSLQCKLGIQLHVDPHPQLFAAPCSKKQLCIRAKFVS